MNVYPSDSADPSASVGGEKAYVGLSDIAACIRELQSFAICGHVSPDGDCIGSQLALQHALVSLGKDAVSLLAGTDPVDDGIIFLPGAADMIPARDFTETVDAFITVDVPSLARIGDAEAVHARTRTTITIDHHIAREPMSQLNHVDTGSASNTMLIWQLIKDLGVEPTPDMALCTYTGLATDTGGFRFQNTDSAALAAASEMVAVGVDPSLVAREVFQNRRLASLRLEAIALDRMHISSDGSFVVSYLTQQDFDQVDGVKDDADPLIDVLRSLEGVRVACILREQGEEVRGSLRAKDDTDVAAIAQIFDGGGHRAAAGFTMQAPIIEAVEQVITLLTDHVSAEGKQA